MNAVALSFKNTHFQITDIHGQPWLRGFQIGSALGYKNPSSDMAKLYDRNADEFTDSMTRVIELTTAGGKQQVRVFSLRGAHLLGMLARTKVAKEFRHWVLDVLERESNRTTPSVKDQLPTRDELIQVIYMLGDRLREIHGWGWGNFDDHLAAKFNKTPREATYGELVSIIRWLHKQTQTVAGRPIVAGVNCPVKPFGLGASLSQQAESLPAMLAAEEKKQLPAPVVVKAADSSDAQCRKREIAESHNSAIARLLTYDGDTSEIGLAECGAATEIVNLAKIVSDAHENFMFCKENQNQTDDNFKCAMLELMRLQNTIMELICC
ncbi:TPA: Bro-N domain-containing protein [Neisseria subflava]